MRCAVCGREGARRLTTVAGQFLGNACEGLCIGLLWESHFIRATGGSEYDHALVLWQWKGRAADVNGVPFREPMPKSSDEVVLDQWAASMGVA